MAKYLLRPLALRTDVVAARYVHRTEELGLWRYPAGGKASKILLPFKSGFVNIYGVTVSVAPSP